MIRSDFLWIIPAVLIAFYQIRQWKKLPIYDETETEVKGQYTDHQKQRIEFFIRVLGFIFWIQIIIPILKITAIPTADFYLKITGYFLILVGFILSKAALQALGDNWSGMVEFRIRKGQKLVTHGIYRWIRHPIYLSAILEVTGFELVANSYLAVIFLVVTAWFTYTHVLKEEAQLEQKFGKGFLQYKKKTKMFIPFIF